MINKNSGFVACFEGVCGLVRFKIDDKDGKNLILEQIWKGKIFFKIFLRSEFIRCDLLREETTHFSIRS